MNGTVRSKVYEERRRNMIILNQKGRITYHKKKKGKAGNKTRDTRKFLELGIREDERCDRMISILLRIYKVRLVEDNGDLLR